MMFFFFEKNSFQRGTAHIEHVGSLLCEVLVDPTSHQQHEEDRTISYPVCRQKPIANVTFPRLALVIKARGIINATF